MSKGNVFNLKEEFFVIDSDSLDQVETKLYGFAIVNNTLIEDARMLGEQDPKGNGAYICVRRNPQQITITQDFIGSYGIYLYKEQDYFALSNSFLALLDHVKQSHKITFHRDFANYMIPAELCSASYSQTMVEEIELLDRCAVIHIDVETKQLNTRYVDYGENTVALNSSEGMDILDAWYHKWTGLIQNLYKENSDIQIDLSGGFDTRMILTLLLGSGIDMNDILVYSIKDDLHTHTEDYEIASAISEHYGFALNNSSMLTHDCVNYSLDDSINISFYLKLCFHKQMYPRIRRYHNLRHCFSGSGGECVRNYWNTTQEEYIQKAVARCKAFSSGTSGEFEDSTRNILSASFEGIKKKFQRFGRAIAPEDLTLNLYRETRCRNHFGKDMIENYYGGSVKYAPLLDPDLQKLKLSDSSCHDKNLLMAVIFDRYNSDLLNFKYDNHRSIDAKTIKYARALNRRFPYDASLAPRLSTRRAHGEKKNTSSVKNGNPAITLNDFKKAVEEIFYSDRNRTMFELLYDRNLYDSISKDIRTRKYQPLQSAYTVIGIGKILQDALANENFRCASIADSFRSTVVENRSSLIDNETLLKHAYLENYVALRLDIKNTGADGNDIEIIEVSDANAKMSKPVWLAKNGNGYTLDSHKGRLELTIRCIRSGTLSIAARGRDVRDRDNNRIPFWIDLQYVSVNDIPQTNNPMPVWHDVPLRLSRKVEDGEMVRILLEWGPHDERKSRLFTQSDATQQKKTVCRKKLCKVKDFILRLLKRLFK